MPVVNIPAGPSPTAPPRFLIWEHTSVEAPPSEPRNSPLTRSNAVHHRPRSSSTLGELLAATNPLEGRPKIVSPRVVPFSASQTRGQGDVRHEIKDYRHDQNHPGRRTWDNLFDGCYTGIHEPFCQHLQGQGVRQPPQGSSWPVQEESRPRVDSSPESKKNHCTFRSRGDNLRKENMLLRAQLIERNIDLKHLREESVSLKREINNKKDKLQQTDAILEALALEFTNLKQGDMMDHAAIAGDVTLQLRQLKSLYSSIGSALTIRGVLTLQMLQLGPPNSQALERPPANQLTSHHGNLDHVLTLDRAVRLADRLNAHPELLASSLTSIRVCSLCNAPKFLSAPVLLAPFSEPPKKDPKTFSEFSSSPHGETTCCLQFICDSCFLPSVVSSITTDWWDNIDSDCWIKCPFPSCRSTLPVQYNVELATLLRKLRDAQALHHIMQFERATRLRMKIEGIDPTPTAEALGRAADLHKQLIDHGFMRSIFDLSQPPNIGIESMSLDSADGRRILRVPILVGLFNQHNPASDATEAPQDGSNSVQRVLRECMVCAETLLDVTDGTLEEEALWEAAIDGFPGDWAWQSRPFPPQSVLSTCSARHPLNVCRTCIGQHLASQLETRGRAGCETLSCPLPGCSHLYSHSEIRTLASAETFAMYDKLRLLSHLATLPNFRWCLREGCGMGQIHDIPPDMGENVAVHRRRNMILCDSCGFEMCFGHQIPWHHGHSCAEYDTYQATGDPAIEATRLWLSTHTKPCRCGAPVEKRGGCFHMTCRSCGFEFCWECLADWNYIHTIDPLTGDARYERRGHNPGCYFREDSAPQATRVAGNTVIEAIGML